MPSSVTVNAQAEEADPGFAHTALERKALRVDAGAPVTRAGRPTVNSASRTA